MYSTSSPSTTTHTTSTLSTKLARLNASPTSTMSTLDYYDEVPLFTPSPKLEQQQQQQQSQQAPPPDCLSASATASVTSSSTFFMDEDSSERSLRAQIESLRQQLAERDLTVNELQRQMQEDKRHHDKLQQRWDLFFSSSNNTTTTTPSSLMSDSSTRGDRRSNMGRGTSYRSAPYTGKTEDSMKTTTMTALEVQKLNDRMDQLEAEKEAALQKAIKLSVALADTRATVSTLESQLEESQRIIAAQNTSTGILLGFGRRTAPPPPPPIASKSSHGKKQKKKSSSRSTSPKPTTKATTTTTLPPVDQASSLGDIELNDDDDEPQQSNDTTAMASIVMTTDECHNDATPADDSAPLEIASERGVQSSQHGGVTTAQPSSERGTTSTGRGWGRFWASSTALTAATS
ncbi:expressed unknown protein [Seminavis robusta]|uniref:Uncharacterized protein n=1 Tax=Seminavis robusta TaxID=568900 RepID=A0A9N8E9X5_9STRA|nr:expressed unknown protein [Seminavis robusta]|eukprot:Sro790_g202840.1 n/a (403) ;mRNA; r:33977-35185